MANMTLREIRAENYGKCFEMDLQVRILLYCWLIWTVREVWTRTARDYIFCEVS
jgi:hypothetical protein